MSASSGRTAHLAWRRSGDTPQALLLHGFSDSAQCWDPLLTSFGMDVITLDARGHGRSELPAEPIGSPRQAADAALVLDELDTGPVFVVGHSMGASTAAALGRSRPDLVRALVLEDPPVGGQPAQPHGRPIPPWLAALGGLDVDGIVRRGRADHPSWPEDELEPWAISKRQLSPEVFERAQDPSPLLTDILREVSCPVLLLYGDPDKGGLISAELAEECRRIAGGPLTAVHTAGVGHNVRREARQRYLSVVGEFLRSQQR